MTSASTFSDTAESLASQTLVSEVQALAQRPFPSDDGLLLHGQPLPANQPIVINSQAALQQIRQHSISNLRSELGGVLLGHAYRDGRRLIVDVLAAMPANSDDHGPIHFTFNADSWSQIHRDKAAKYPELEIVGWFHTHPGLGVFYSSDDVVVHTAAFTLPWHVGLVVDPIKNEACYFGWVDGALEPLTGYYEQPDIQESPIVPWRTFKTAVWHQHATEEFYASYDNGQEAPRVLQSSGTGFLGSASTQLQLALAGSVIGLFLGFFLLVGWAIPLQRQNAALTQVVNTLAEETAVNAAVCPDPNLRLLSPADGATLSRGEPIPFVGTAVQPDAVRYQLEVRFLGQQEWTLVEAQRRDVTLGEITRWDARELSPGTYEVRLTAVDNNNIRLNNVAPCQVTLVLTP